jgi:hypothetical protein
MPSWNFRLNRGLSFQELWAELKGCYKSIDVRCLALKDNEKWKNLMVIAFSSMKGKDIIEKEADKDFSTLKELKVDEIEELGIFHEVFSPEDFLNFVWRMEKGEITLNHQFILLRQGYESRGITDSPRVIPVDEYGRYPVANYEFYGSSVEISGKLHEKLESLGLLYGIEEVASTWLKMPRIIGYGINAIIVLPIYFELKTFEISDNEFFLSLKLHKCLYPKLETLFVLRKKFNGIYRAVENKLIKSNEFSCFPVDSEFLECKTRYKFNTFLNLENEIYFCIKSDKLGVLSYEHKLVKDIVKKIEFKEPFMNFLTKFISLEIVENLLEGKQQLLKKKDPSTEFQRVVSYLLSLVNMKVMEIGDTLFGVVKREDGTIMGDIDIIAQGLQSGKLYVVQCSINPIEMRDISSLANISYQLRRNGFQAEPLIVVRDFVAPEIKENKSRIRVIDKEDLLRIVQALKMENINEARRILFGS